MVGRETRLEESRLIGDWHDDELLPFFFISLFNVVVVYFVFV